MEKRKLLLVAVSVGVFLVIVLSAAILIFTPSGGGAVIARPLPGNSASGTEAVPRPPASADAADMVRNTGDLQGLRAPPPGSDSSSGPASASATQENNFYFNGENAPASPIAERPIAERPVTERLENGPAQVVINVPQPSAPGVPSPRSPASPASSAGAGARSGSGSPAAPARAPFGSTAAASSGGAASGASSRPAANTAPAGPSRPATSAAVKPAPASPASPSAASPAAASPASSVSSRTPARSQQDYWIQTGAFSALVRAESAKEILASKGLVSIIDDREVEGQTWYRVRVGPYTSENEANYWLALVRAIDGFDGSQVRSSLR